MADVKETTQVILDGDAAADDVTYTVTVFTGTLLWAGTDANIRFTLYGTADESEQQTFENEGLTTFENGMEDVIKFGCPYLGTLTKLRIGHDNTGFGPGWFLDKVTVYDPKTGETAVFPCNRWLATNADDGMIERELTREAYPYTIHIFTGKRYGSGTKTNVHVTIYGRKGESGEHKFENEENSMKNSFNIESISPLGTLYKVRVGHDNTGWGPAWFLEKVEVEDGSTGEIVEFACGKWLATDREDGLIRRDFVMRQGSVEDMEEERARLDEERKRKEDEEKKKADEERARLDEERKRKEDEEKKKADEERARLDEERKRKEDEEKKKADAERAKLDEEAKGSKVVTYKYTTTITTRIVSWPVTCLFSPIEPHAGQQPFPVNPYKGMPRCEHLKPVDPVVKAAQKNGFCFCGSGDDAGPPPVWYGGLDTQSTMQISEIRDEDLDRLVEWEKAGTQGWKKTEKSRDFEIWKLKAFDGGPPITKTIITLNGVPYTNAVEILRDWNTRKDWDKTFDKVEVLENVEATTVVHCLVKKREFFLAVLDRHDSEEPYFASAWRNTSHPNIDQTKSKKLKLYYLVSGLVIRPVGDGSQSSVVTLICQVKGSVPSRAKGTFLAANPAKWSDAIKKHHANKTKESAAKEG